jgi:hypothetical protein
MSWTYRSNIGSSDSPYAQAYKQATGEAPRYLNAPQLPSSYTPFLQGMYAPFMASFGNAGFAPPAAADPHGGQIREMLGGRAGSKARKEYDRMELAARKAAAEGDNMAYIRLPNGTVVPRGRFSQNYLDKIGGIQGELTGLQAADYFRNKASAWMPQQ